MCENKEISNQKVFESVVCFLNFQDDRVEFQFKAMIKFFLWEFHEFFSFLFLKVAINTWTDLTELLKVISYEKLDSSTFERFTCPLLIVNDETAKDSDFVTEKIHGGFKNSLLNLFSPHNKEFKLTIDYEMNEMKYQTTFVVKIPNIDQKWVFECFMKFVNTKKCDTFLPTISRIRSLNFNWHLTININESGKVWRLNDWRLNRSKLSCMIHFCFHWRVHKFFWKCDRSQFLINLYSNKKNSFDT